jgi:predicted transcriptional regulator of viral defense system
VYPNLNRSKLKQESIDKAFSKPQRVSNNFYTYNSFKFYFFEKKIEGLEIGIIYDVENDIKYTDLERTLIDIAIKPMYAGGVFEVLETFKSAKELLDVTKMKDYLRQLNYIYPYDQVIGFYLECAEYNTNQINVFYKKEKQLSFYLTHNIANKEFSEKWKIYYPLGFKLL